MSPQRRRSTGGPGLAVPRARRAATLAAAVALGAGLAGCGSDPVQAYCGQVQADQTRLTTVLAGGGEAALLDALPIFQQLQAKAPTDIRGDWTTVVRSLSALQKALAAAHVDPKKYDAKHPPAGVTPAQQQAIAQAASGLVSQRTLLALQAVQQEARDVCHTPLSLS